MADYNGGTIPSVTSTISYGEPVETPETDLTKLPNMQAWHNAMFYLQNEYTPVYNELAKVKALGFDAYQATNWWKDHQLWILAGSVGLFALLMLRPRR